MILARKSIRFLLPSQTANLTVKSPFCTKVANDRTKELVMRIEEEEKATKAVSKLMEGEHSVEEARKCATRLQECGIIDNTNSVLQKPKPQASQRWRNSSIDDLENELNSLEEKKEVKNIVLVDIKTIILKKLAGITPIPLARVIPILERFIPSIEMMTEMRIQNEKKMDPWEKSINHRFRDYTVKLYGITMRQCVMEGDWRAVERLWTARGFLRPLQLAPCLAFAYHESRGGSDELSREIIKDIRSNGLSVGKNDLYELGEIFHDLSAEELDEVGEWLKKEMNLEASDVERIMAPRVKRNTQEMISGGFLDAAFHLMRESSEKSKIAIGHIEVMRAAIRENNGDILESTFNIVSDLHSKPSAILDLSFSFLLEKREKQAEARLKDPSIKLSKAKISFFIKHALEENRIDVIHALFSILVSCPLEDKKLRSHDLNYVALIALKVYVPNNEIEAAMRLVKEIEESTLVVEGRLKELMDTATNLSKSSRSSSV